MKSCTRHPTPAPGINGVRETSPRERRVEGVKEGKVEHEGSLDLAVSGESTTSQRTEIRSYTGFLR